MPKPDDKILAETKYLRLIDRHGWYFVERPFASGVVAIIATTDDGKLVLVQQHRAAVACQVIELPAGLVGDEAGHEDEALEKAAHRELLEETGYDAAHLERIGDFVTAPAISSEAVTYLRATGLRKVGPGGGVGDEAITVVEVPLAEADTWLHAQARAGATIAIKVWAGLCFARGR